MVPFWNLFSSLYSFVDNYSGGVNKLDHVQIIGILSQKVAIISGKLMIV